jgi:hypothetical protein
MATQFLQLQQYSPPAWASGLKLLVSVHMSLAFLLDSALPHGNLPACGVLPAVRLPAESQVQTWPAAHTPAQVSGPAYMHVSRAACRKQAGICLPACLRTSG